MESWEQCLNYRYTGARHKVSLVLDQDNYMPDEVELYVWKEVGLIAFVGTDGGTYRVHHRDVWKNGVREYIFSTRLGEFLTCFFQNGQNVRLEAWFDSYSRAVIVGEQRQEDIRFNSCFQRMNLSALFRVRLLNTRETGQIKLFCPLPPRVSAVRQDGLLKLTADEDGPIECENGQNTTEMTHPLFSKLCGDWDTVGCWGRACVDGWVIGPDIMDVAQVGAVDKLS